MDWKEIGGKIASAAPMLGTLLGGPMGGAIGSVVSMIASALGCEPTPEAVNATITNNPDALLKLRELEMTNKVRLEELSLKKAELDIESAKVAAADTASARSREVEITKATGKRNWGIYLLAWFNITAFFAAVGYILYLTGYCGKELKDVSGIVFMLLGNLSSAYMLVNGYFYGSSSGSAELRQVLVKK